MGTEKVIARVKLENSEALTVCDGIKGALRIANLPEDTIITMRTATGETITSLEIIEDQTDEGTEYTMVARLK